MRPPEFWRRDDAAARLVAATLSPIGRIYGAVVAFNAARAKPYRSSAKVICIGNLTAGGSGKTPVVRAVAQELTARDARVFILSRGYGGRLHGPVLVDVAQHSAADVGDEPLMLANTCSVIVCRNRAAGARLAESCGAEVIVMDDGHQNFSLAKDLSVVVIDAETGFGNGRVLPAGPLREPPAQGLARAQAVILMGGHRFALPGFAGSVLRARLVPEGASLAGQHVVAFAGIGRPGKFFETLRSMGAEVIETRAFADHHVYDAAELDSLKARSQQVNAALVTTEKDHARLPRERRRGVGVVGVRAEFEDAQAFASLLAPISPARSETPSS